MKAAPLKPSSKSREELLIGKALLEKQLRKSRRKKKKAIRNRLEEVTKELVKMPIPGEVTPARISEGEKNGIANAEGKSGADQAKIVPAKVSEGEKSEVANAANENNPNQAKVAPTKVETQDVSASKAEGAEPVTISASTSTAEEHWYSPEGIGNLSQMITVKELLPHVFLDISHSSGKSFEDQFEVIMGLNKALQSAEQSVKGICFICKEPGAGQNHYIIGVLMGPSLIIINPIGATTHRDFYDIMDKIQRKHELTVTLSTTAIQKEEGALIHCGPICIELMNHLSQLKVAEIAKAISTRKKHNERDSFYSFDITVLPESLKALTSASRDEYESRLAEIREKHKKASGTDVEMALNKKIQAAINVVLASDETRKSRDSAIKKSIEDVRTLLSTRQDELLAKKLGEELAGKALPSKSSIDGDKAGSSTTASKTEEKTALPSAKKASDIDKQSQEVTRCLNEILPSSSPKGVINRYNVSSIVNQYLAANENVNDKPIDKEHWYDTDDITDYVNLIIEEELGGYRYRAGEYDTEGRLLKQKYLLQHSNKEANLVLVTSAVDVAGRASPIDLFLDKARQERNNLALTLDKVLPELGKLDKTNEANLIEQLVKIQLKEIILIDKKFVTDVINELKKAKFNDVVLKERIKELHVRQDYNLALALDKLLPELSKLDKTNEANLVEQLGKAILIDKDFITTVIKELKAAGFNKEALEKRIKELHVKEDYRDVFDEITPKLLGAKGVAQILFPYNKTNIHWLVGEIRISKEGKQYTVDVYTHDPYGSGMMSSGNFEIIKSSIERRIKEEHSKSSGEEVTVVCANRASSYRRRQAFGDSSSCGVIVAEDMIRRIQGQILTREREELYEKGAVILRKAHIEKVMKYLPRDNGTRVNFINRNTIHAPSKPIKQMVSATIEPEEIDRIIKLIDSIKNVELRKAIIDTIGDIQRLSKDDGSHIIAVRKVIEEKPVELKSRKIEVVLEEPDINAVNELHRTLFSEKGRIKGDIDLVYSIGVEVQKQHKLAQPKEESKGESRAKNENKGKEEAKSEDKIAKHKIEENKGHRCDKTEPKTQAFSEDATNNLSCALKFEDAIKFLISNYDELSGNVDITQEFDFTESSSKLHIKVYSDKLGSSLRDFFDSKNISSSIQVTVSKKTENKSNVFISNLDACLLLYAPAISNERKAKEFITKLSEKYKSLASIAIKEPGDHRNILIQAVYYNKLEVVKLLMEKDPKLYETVDRLGNNPLLSASIYGRIDIINYFLNNCKRNLFVKSEYDQLNPLFCAIYGGEKETVKYWLNNYPALYNDVDRLGNTPIAFARIYNHPEVAKYLESYAAELSLPSDKNARKDSYPEIAKHIESHIAEPSLPLDKICDSNYSWGDCKGVYFSLNDDSFRNYYVANIKDKWGRNAIHILMSSIAIILSSPQLIFDEKSQAYRSTIERAANQWEKIKLFIEYKVRVNELDNEGKYPITAFLLALSKRQNETPFGWDTKSQQDKGMPYRKHLKIYLQLLLQHVQIDPEAIKKQYESQKWKGQDLLLLLTKWYPELGEILTNVVVLYQKKLSFVSRKEPEVIEPKKASTCDIYLREGIAASGLEKLWSLLEYPMNILCGANGSGKTLLIRSLESYIPQLSKSAVSLNKDCNIVQKILNKEDIKNAEILLLDEPDTSLDLGNIKRLMSNLSKHYKGMKVIMTTHQIGTIAFFPKNIFYVQMNKPANITISACHPMLARLRMTKGLREFKEIGAHVQIDVFVESQDDASFYQKIYRLLHQNRDKPENAWISDRYRPNFLCISLGGGHSAQAAIKAISIRDSSDEEQLITQPFAILDGDSRARDIVERTLPSQEVDSSKLIFTKRYSLENYLYDPILICSVMPLEKLNIIGNQSIKLCLMKCKEAVDSYFQSSGDSSYSQAKIHENIREYFNIVCNLQPDSSQGSLQSPQQKGVLMTYFHIGRSKKLDCIYPDAFLSMRGHDIERVFNSVKPAEQRVSQISGANPFKLALLANIQSSDSICIANDLIEVFVELNKKMKLQINKFIKPAKYKAMILEERTQDSKSLLAKCIYSK